MVGDDGIEPSCLVSETSVIAIIRIPNKMVERQRLGLCILPSSADVVYPNSLQIRHSAKSDTDRFIILFEFTWASRPVFNSQIAPTIIARW